MLPMYWHSIQYMTRPEHVYKLLYKIHIQSSANHAINS